jgi:hypothetical protein
VPYEVSPTTTQTADEQVGHIVDPCAEASRDSPLVVLTAACTADGPVLITRM